MGSRCVEAWLGAKGWDPNVGLCWKWPSEIKLFIRLQPATQRGEQPSSFAGSLGKRPHGTVWAEVDEHLLPGVQGQERSKHWTQSPNPSLALLSIHSLTLDDHPLSLG